MNVPTLGIIHAILRCVYYFSEKAGAKIAAKTNTCQAKKQKNNKK
jgi:hypothetical protein